MKKSKQQKDRDIIKISTEQYENYNIFKKLKNFGKKSEDLKSTINFIIERNK